MYVVIVNPIAGNGKANKIYKQVRESSYLQNKATFYISEYKGHIKEIITDLESNKSDISLLIVIGGDGTVHEVINSLSNKETRIAYIPGGSGNDFARGINNRKQPDDIIKHAIEHQKEAQYWLCSYETDLKKQSKLINCIGFGFDAVVTNRATELSFRALLSKIHLDSLVYLFAALRELFSYKPLQIILTIDGVKKTFSRVLFLTVNNQPYMGGGMKINPKANNNDSHFSVVVVDSIPKWKIFLLFGTVFFGGHVLFKGVHIYQAKKVTVSGRMRLPYQVDGEYGETKHATINKLYKPIYLKGTK